MRLDGRTALVTGASGGIGGAIARALVDRGAHVVLSGRNEQALEELRGGIGDRAEVLVADLSTREGLAALLDGGRRIDALVANAALPASGPILEYETDQIDRALDVNLRAPIHLARALAPRMRERGEGHLVFVSSLAGKVANPGGALYSATKFGLRGFAYSLREDLHGTGVGVTCVFPGFVSGAGLWAETGMTLPRGVGTRSADQVAAAVIEGIERDRAEIDVAPLVVRMTGRLWGVAPGLFSAAQRRLGSQEFSTELGERQRHKR